jgi:hypothetical protein
LQKGAQLPEHRSSNKVNRKQNFQLTFDIYPKPQSNT